MILTDENKRTHGNQFMLQIETGLNSRRAKGIADGTEDYPANPRDRAHPRTTPPEPTRPAGNNADIQARFREDRAHWQFVVKQLKDDRESYDDRHAAGFDFIISCLSIGIKIDLATVIANNDLEELYTAVQNLVGRNPETILTFIEEDYHKL